jgi:hypothetical protein
MAALNRDWEVISCEFVHADMNYKVKVVNWRPFKKKGSVIELIIREIRTPNKVNVGQLIICPKLL